MKRKTIAIICLAIALVVPNSKVTYGAKSNALSELTVAEKHLNDVVLQSSQQQLRELENIDTTSTLASDKSKLEVKKSELRRIKGYKDFVSDTTVDIAVLQLREKGYEVDGDFEILCKEIEKYKNENPASDPKDTVLHFDQKNTSYDNEISNRFFTIAFDTAQAYSISYTSWTKLTTSEKLLVAASPTAAVITQALQKKAFDFTSSKFGYNGLGDKSDGYRHGIWNALMTRDINRAWADAISTAHEDRPKSELDTKQSDGYTGWQHRTMDLNNNKVGRGVISWYEFSTNCSDATVKSRISAKLTNKSGEITWLHD